MNIGSLFSGGGGGDLGFRRAGFDVSFGCEIDPKARSVFRYHHPNIPIYQDVREVTRERLIADDVTIPKLIMGGSPCQDLSLAGRRAGLGGSRSGLFFEQCRIADELGVDWVVWENVVGSFSSNGGEDFAEILGGLTGHTPHVPRTGWRNSGICIGSKRIAVWRVLDAQNFGVPQRRRRVFVVSGPRTVARRVVGVLLHEESSDGDSPKNEEQRRDSGETIRRCYASNSQGKLIDRTQTLTTARRYDFRSESFIFEEVMIEGELKMIARGLTPLESERLMGWPDNYTAQGITDSGELIELTDGPRYKICGNGVVSHVTEWIGKRILETTKTP